MRILKFGGSSVADARRIRRVSTIVRQARSDGPTVVVVSALGGVTDDLVDLVGTAARGVEPDGRLLDELRARHHRILDELAPGDRSAGQGIDRTLDELDRLIKGVAYIGDCPPAVRDRILATGERLSGPIVAAAVRASGARSVSVDGADVIRTDSSFGDAAVDQKETDAGAARILLTLAEDQIPVVTGFIGSDHLGSTTTLGRGGSDLTATVLGAALDADRVEIWTDVNGIFTAPPRVVPGSRPQPCVSYDEASELARFGAAVLFSKTVAPVRERAIPIVVRNTFDPDGASTWVDDGSDVPSGARSLASVEHAVLLKVHPRDTGDSPAEEVSAESPHCLIATLAAATGEWTLVIEEENAENVHGRLLAAGLSVSRVDDTSVVAVVGSRLLQQPWVAGRALEALGRRDIPLMGVVSPSEHSVCVVVQRSDHERALAILHEALMLSHVANRASDSFRKKITQQQGDHHGTTSPQRRRDRRDRNGRTAARLPAA